MESVNLGRRQAGFSQDVVRGSEMPIKESQDGRTWIQRQPFRITAPQMPPAG
jgi:hypothetical protein